MPHSKVTSKGQTTIPGKIRKALRIKPGDKLEYVVEGDHATIRVHLGTRSLKGVLSATDAPMYRADTEDWHRADSWPRPLVLTR